VFLYRTANEGIISQNLILFRRKCHGVFGPHPSYMTVKVAVILTVHADKADIAVFCVGQAN